MSRVRLARALASFLLMVMAAPVVAQDAGKPAEPVEPAGMSFAAADMLGSVKDMDAFADEFWNARFDLTRAAKVENLVIEKDSARFTLTGWVFKKAAVRGITSRVIFFGTGRFALTAPIAMERQQIKRFLGSESIDQPLARCRFDFNGADDQAIFERLTYVTEAAAEAREKSEEAREWLDETAKFYAKSMTPEQEASRRLNEYQYALAVYERLLEPGLEGSMLSEGRLPKTKPGEKPKTTLAALTFLFNPDDAEEMTVYGAFEHGDGERFSQITSFACCGKYEGGLEWAATSPLLETQRKDEIAMDKDTLRIRFDPGAKRDIYMTSTMELRFLKDRMKFVELGITPYMGATKCWIDGKEVAFSQPAIPGVPGLHVGTITIPLPRVYGSGERVSVKLELEGKILANVDGATWIVKEEDNWFPSPSQGVGAPRTVFDTTLLTPQGFTAVSNGTEGACEGETPAGHGCARFVTNTGISFAAFNIGRDIQVAKTTALDGTPIHVYAPVDFAKTSESMLNNAKLSHAVYEDWFGEDPYDRLYLTPHPKGHGRGSASLLLLYVGAFYSATQWNEMASWSRTPYEPWRMLAFVAHEIAHQWWGGASGIRSYRDQWFSEGFADYGCNMVMEAYDLTNKTNWRGAQLHEWMSMLTKDEGYIHDVAPLALGGRIASAENRDGYEGYYQNYIYSKGAYVMHMLRTIARAKAGDKVKGDELFKKAVHDFMASCRGKDPSTLDLMNSFAGTYGLKLDWFFKQWVYGTGLPKVTFSYQVAPAKDGKGWIVRGRVKQKDTAFIFPVAVSLHQKGAKGEAPFVYQWIMKADDTFEFPPIPFQPDKVTINEDHGLLAIVTPTAWEGAASGQ